MNITKEPIIKNFENHIKERETQAANLAEILINSEKPLVTSITGKYGSGKTCFLELLRLELIKNGDDKSPQIFYFNAWKYDYFQNPIYGFLDAISPPKKITAKIREKFKKVTGAFEPIISAGIGLVVDSQTPGLGAIAKESTKKAIQKSNKNPLIKDIVNKHSIEQILVNINKALSGYINALNSNKNGRVYILIDELDRCKPNFTVELLELFKHILFDNEEQSLNISYVFAYDNEQLQAIIKHCYGNINTEDYLWRFFDCRYKLSGLSSKKLIESHFGNISELSKHLEVMVDIVNSLGVTPRNIEKSIHIIKSAISYETKLFNLPRNLSVYSIYPDRILQVYLLYIFYKLQHPNKYHFLVENVIKQSENLRNSENFKKEIRFLQDMIANNNIEKNMLRDSLKYVTNDLSSSNSSEHLNMVFSDISPTYNKDNADHYIHSSLEQLDFY